MPLSHVTSVYTSGATVHLSPGKEGERVGRLLPNLTAAVRVNNGGISKWYFSGQPV